MSIVDQFSEKFNESIQYINTNNIISPVIALLLILYVVMAAPKLPKSVASFFGHPIVKFVYMLPL